MPPKKAENKSKYVKKDPISHILDRPDMYVGSLRPKETEEFVCGDDFKIYQKKVNISPALLRIFIEPLSNVIDNVARSRASGAKLSKIEISVDKKTGETTFINDGEVIPVELHPEEKCYNHTMIFGQLLTSSNYDDTEDREDISGKNGLGIKACFSRGTQVPKFSGEIVNIEDLKIGDLLIGDDGKPRKIIAKTQGRSKMYKITQPRGESYIVNENHILSLKMSDHKVIFWNNTRQGWKMVWFCKKENNVKSKEINCNGSETGVICPECEIKLYGNLKRHYSRVHKGKTPPEKERSKPTLVPPIETEKILEARKELEEFAKTIPDDNTIDISVREYMKLSTTARSRLTGFLGSCVDWSEKEVSLDPYILGLWLGDGGQDGYTFAINWKADPETLNYILNWGENNDACFTRYKDTVSYKISSIKNKGKMGQAPLKKHLRKYRDLIYEKHIPKEYLFNSKKIRLAVLAGIIDTDGTVSKDHTRITITQGLNHTRVANDIIYLAKSLGFMCSSHISNTSWVWKGEKKKGKAIMINISGDGVEEIPTLLPRKKCLPPKKRNTLNTGTPIIIEMQEDDYFGVQIDGNSRFVLKDFTVVHNCSIFSKTFSVEGADPVNKKLFRQEWRNNMKETSEPKITSYKLARGYTKVIYFPDFQRFGIKSYTDDIIALFKKYAVDCAMITKVKTFFNGEEIPCTNLCEYAKLYGDTEETLSIKTKDCEVVLTPSDEFQAISFANGIHTPLGGTHVDSWTEGIFRPIVEKLNKPKKPQINIGDIKKYFRLFVCATVKKPEFDSQSKRKLEGPEVKADVKKTHITAITKWSVMERLEDIIRLKEMVVLKKSERKKRGYEKVEGLDPANNEGGTKGKECTLILVEGLSAKTYAVWGIQEGAFGKTGRDWFGIYALRGKVLNCRKAKPVTIAKNHVVSDIIKALGISYGVDYTNDDNFNKLRYGRVMIITDADVDGLHISGLLQNMFHALFPTLLQRKESFLTCMQTPIVRVFTKGEDKVFYDENEYRDYVKANDGKKINKKYYKGLGTNKEEDVADTFGKKLVQFVEDEQTLHNMNKVFSDDSSVRKTWLDTYDPNKRLVKWNGNKPEKVQVSFSDFINTELIKFSVDDCKRSLPNLFDGLKEGHRKVLYICLSENLKYTGKSMKVAQLASLVALKTEYHHGEQNLESTITSMANCFVGSNNVPLLYRDGQFGSRDEGGKDAAAGRYIFTKLDYLTRLLFRQEDDPLLNYLENDGTKVEPEYYVPILPTILINGCIVGIGTGWSCSVPCYNPLNLINCVKIWLDNGNKAFIEEDGSDIKMSLFPDLTPWYRGFKGEIKADKDGKFISLGNIEKDPKGKVLVSELPIGLWTSKFTETLEEYKTDKKISNYKNYCTPKEINYVITESSDGIKCTHKSLGLEKKISTSNMVLWADGQLKKFNSPEEILDYYCGVRYNLYTKRKAYQLNGLEKDIKYLGNKRRFLQEVRDGEIKLFTEKGGKKVSRKTLEIEAELEERGYDKTTDTEEKDDEETESKGGYNYLLRLQINSITAEKIDKLKKDIDSKIKLRDELKSKTEKDLWLNDLEEFKIEYEKWLSIIDKEKPKKKKKTN